MTIDDIRNTFDVIDYGDFEEVKFGNIYIEIIDFKEKFSGSDITFDSLVENENTTNGWKKVFEEQKEQGILD